MANIKSLSHKAIITTIDELIDLINRMQKDNNDFFLNQHKNDVLSWRDYFSYHSDIEELRSLESEITERFVHKYEVIMVPYELNKFRLEIYRKLILLLHKALH